MNEHLKDILANLNTDIDQETLLLYLQGKLSAQKQHEVEMKMLENDFNADALQGLESLKNKTQLSILINELNKDLKKKTEKKKKFRKKLELKFDPIIIITIIIILALAIISYIIIGHQIHKH